jgi:GT2 family glycosyltransferase
MKITAIIVNYYTSNFLRPLLKVLNDDEMVAKIIVADNSDEKIIPSILKDFNKSELMSFPDNIGFGAAINEVTQAMESDWWLIINPDTLPEAGMVEKLFHGAVKMNALIAGPRFYWDNEKTFRLPPALGSSLWIEYGIESAGKFDLDSRLLSFYWSMRFHRFWNEPEPFFEPFLSGACLLIKNDKKYFKDGKIFDDRYFMYYEDTDLCVEAMKSNQNIICVPEAIAVHYWNQAPSNDKPNMMRQSGEKFNLKHFNCSHPTISESVPYQPENIENLGILTKSPTFYFENQQEIHNLYIEFGVNHFFVPNAQADYTQNIFNFPESIWETLTNGDYFTRLWDPVTNKTLKIWNWKKA